MLGVFGVIVAATARCNMASMLYVPPNELLLTGKIHIGSSQVAVDYIGNVSGGATCTMPASVILESKSVARMSPTEVADYVYLHYQTELSRVQCLLSYSTGASPTDEDNAQMQLSVSDLSDHVSLVYDYYGRNFLFLGPIPESYRSHLVDRGNVTVVGATTDLSAIPMSVTTGTTTTTTMHLSAAIWRHDLIAADCGRLWVIGGTTVSFLVPCTGSERVSGVSAVSLRELGAGVHVTPGRVTMYTANEKEYNMITSWAFVGALMLYMGTWLMWTRDLPEKIDSDEWRTALWINMAVNSAPITSSVLLLILSRNLWSAVQRSHGMYNIETIDMVGMEALEMYVAAYAYVFTPVTVAASLLVVAYGNAVYGSAEPTFSGAAPTTDGARPPLGDTRGARAGSFLGGARAARTGSFLDDTRLFSDMDAFAANGMRAGAKWLSWSSRDIRSYRFETRLVIFFVAYAVVISITLLFWSVTYRSTESAVLSAVYITIVMIFWSSGERVHELMHPVYAAMRSHDRSLLAFLGWSFRVLVLTCVPPNTPYSIDHAYALQFHTFVTMGAGAFVAETTGRTLAVMRGTGNDENLLLFLPLAAFAFSFAVLFGFGSMYGSTGALRDEAHTTLVCSTTLTFFITAGTYLYKTHVRL